MFKPFFFIAKKIISENNFENGIDLEIQSEIPIGAGLGSSSACCVAAAASVSNLFSNPEKNQVLELAIAAEKTIFPKTSGADCTVSVFGGIIDYQKDNGYKNFQRMVADFDQTKFAKAEKEILEDLGRKI